MICQNCGATTITRKYNAGEKGESDIFQIDEYCQSCQCVVPGSVKQITKAKKDSLLSIIAIIFSLFGGIIAFGSFILAIIDLTINDKTKRHLGSRVAIVFCVIRLLVSIAVGEPVEDGIKVEITPSIATNETSYEEQLCLVGETFHTDKLEVLVSECNLDFTDYDNDYTLYQLEDGYKYIEVSFDYKNSSEEDAYVSIYDYNCYADDVLMEQSYNFGGDFINATLSSGRKTSFKTYYVVPIEAKEIELEYKELVSINKNKIIIKLQ